MSSSSESSSPESRRKKARFRKVAASEQEQEFDDGGHDLLSGVRETSSLMQPVQIPEFPIATVEPCDPLKLLRPTSSISSAAIAHSSGRSEVLPDTRTAQNVMARPADLQPTGKSVTVADVAVPILVEHMEMPLSPHLQHLSEVQLPPALPTLDVASILSSIQNDTKIIGANGGCELNWEHFIRHDVQAPLHEEDIQEDVLGSDPDPVFDVGHDSFPGKPLFHGSPLSVDDTVISLLTFAITEHLNGQAFTRLLNLIKLLLPQPNNLPKSLSTFYKYFDCDQELSIFYFCNVCWRSRASAKDLCTDCTDPKRKVKYFITSPLTPQLSKFFARPGFMSKLEFRNTRQKVSPENIEDFYDGDVYKGVEETVLQTNIPNSINLSLTWYTDGISMYESSPYTLWPFMFIINELPPQERYKPENLLLAGLWGCEEKPHPNVFLLPIYYDVVKLSQGSSVNVHGFDLPFIVKAFVLKGTCDVPARTSFMNMKAHSGYCSCCKCLIVGEKSKDTGNVLVFPHADQLQMRTEECYTVSVTEAVKCKDGYLGVYGPSILSYMTFSDFIPSIAIDTLHCVDIGITKQMLNLWFDSSHSKEEFSISQKIDVVNARLFGLKLPHFVQRAPLGVDKLAYWKASLFRNFLLVMSLPVLNGILPDNAFENLCNFVNGIALLNQNSISPGDLEHADQLLCRFSEGFQTLYGKRHMTSNVHQTRHLAQAVRDTGPLWTSSCYKFEDINGKLALLAHGTTHASLQIYKHFFALSELGIVIKTVKSQSLKQFCNSMLNPKVSVNVSDKVCSGTYVVGAYGLESRYRSDIIELLPIVLETQSSFQTFSRLYRNRQLYTSLSYARGSRVSHYCRYTVNLTVCHGVILTFVKSSPNVQYFALISRSVTVPAMFPRYYFDSNTNQDLDLVPVTNLECVSFSLKINNQIYVVDPINSFEME